MYFCVQQVDGLITGDGGEGIIIRGRGTDYKRTFTVWFVLASVSRLFFRVETSRGRNEY